MITLLLFLQIVFQKAFLLRVIKYQVLISLTQGKISIALGFFFFLIIYYRRLSHKAFGLLTPGFTVTQRKAGTSAKGLGNWEKYRGMGTIGNSFSLLNLKIYLIFQVIYIKMLYVKFSLFTKLMLIAITKIHCYHGEEFSSVYIMKVGSHLAIVVTECPLYVWVSSSHLILMIR